MSRYYINYNTGAGNEWIDGTLEDAMKAAESGLSYTQRPVSIEDESEKEIAILPWYDVEPEEDDVVICQFGEYGFYGEWVEL